MTKPTRRWLLQTSRGWLVILEEMVDTEQLERVVHLFKEATGDDVAVLPGFIYGGRQQHPTSPEEWDRLRALLDQA